MGGIYVDMKDWLLEHDNELTVVLRPPPPPDLNPIQHFWDVVELCSNSVMLSQQYGPKPLRNVPNTLLEILMHLQ